MVDQDTMFEAGIADKLTLEIDAAIAKIEQINTRLKKESDFHFEKAGWKDKNGKSLNIPTDKLTTDMTFSRGCWHRIQDEIRDLEQLKKILSSKSSVEAKLNPSEEKKRD